MKSLRLAGLPRRFAAGAVLLTAALAVALGPASIPAANAKTITATCADNSTDAATLNSAISGSGAGDQILISGTCLLTAPITLLGNRSYEGGSRTGTVLQQASGANLPYLLASDTYVSNANYTGLPFTIHQLTIDCNSQHNTAATNGLVLHSWQTTAQDLQILNCGGSGILVANATPNGTTLANGEVNGVIKDDYIDNSGVSGVYVSDSGSGVTDWRLDDNAIADSGQDGIHLQNAAGWYIDGNHLYGDGGNGIYASRIFSTSIQNNYIEDFGDNGGSTTYYGITATAQGGPTSTITGNRVFMFPGDKSGSSYRYIGVTQVNYGTGAVTVTGNSIIGAASSADTGFYFNAGSGVTLSVTSGGNSVASVGTARTTGTGVTISAGI
jgi:Right handed beta helix region